MVDHGPYRVRLENGLRLLLPEHGARVPTHKVRLGELGLLLAQQQLPHLGSRPVRADDKVGRGLGSVLEGDLDPVVLDLQVVERHAPSDVDALGRVLAQLLPRHPLDDRRRSLEEQISRVAVVELDALALLCVARGGVAEGRVDVRPQIGGEQLRERLKPPVDHEAHRAVVCQWASATGRHCLGAGAPSGLREREGGEGGGGVVQSITAELEAWISLVHRHLEAILAEGERLAPTGLTFSCLSVCFSSCFSSA